MSRSGPSRWSSGRKWVGAAGIAAALAVVGGLALLGVGKGAGEADGDWTGLEWQDITATSDGLFNWEPNSGFVIGSVVDFSGTLVAAYYDGVWTSADGRTWSHVPESPRLTDMVAIKGRLIGRDRSGLLISDDARSWRSVESPILPFAYLVSNSDSAILVTARAADPLSDALSPGPWELYATTDGVTWRRATVPDEFAGKANCFISFSSLPDGYFASCTESDPAGLLVGDLWGYEIAESERIWSSPDGLVWTRLDPNLAPGRRFASAHAGALGWAAGLDDLRNGTSGGVHTTDGRAWITDRDYFLAGLDPRTGWYGVQADGRHILITVPDHITSVPDRPAFSVSRGDGRWRQLEQSGDPGGLPFGHAYLLPNGVLYEGGGRLYFGEAVSGRAIKGSPWPGSAIQSTPQPTASPAQPGTWTALSPITPLAGGPVGATSVTRWAHGYVALRDAPVGGLLTAWTSSDGLTWSRLSDGTFGIAGSGRCAQAGDSVVVATWGLGDAVWVSSDGYTWRRRAGESPAIGERPMAGSSLGLLAIVSSLEPQLVAGLDRKPVFLPDPPRLPALDVIASVAVSGHHLAAVGNEMTKQENVPPYKQTWEAAAWWSDDGMVWTRAEVESTTPRMADVVAGSGGFVAVGEPDEYHAYRIDADRYWISPDGRSWRHPGDTGPFFMAGPGFAGDGHRIVGWGSARGQRVFWVSTDGLDWTQLRLAGGVGDVRAATSDLRVFVLDDGVLFVTAERAWFGRAVVQQ